MKWRLLSRYVALKKRKRARHKWKAAIEFTLFQKQQAIQNKPINSHCVPWGRHSWLQPWLPSLWTRVLFRNRDTVIKYGTFPKLIKSDRGIPLKPYKSTVVLRTGEKILCLGSVEEMFSVAPQKSRLPLLSLVGRGSTPIWKWYNTDINDIWSDGIQYSAWNWRIGRSSSTARILRFPSLCKPNAIGSRGCHSTSPNALHWKGISSYTYLKARWVILNGQGVQGKARLRPETGRPTYKANRKFRCWQTNPRKPLSH